MKRVIYEVHSDEDENNVMQSFEGKGSKQVAIAYAKRNREDKTWVDKVLYDDNEETYEYLDCVWCYDWEE